MRGALITSIVLAGCYAPAVPAGAPCSPSGDCPDGQSCVGGFCVAQTGTIPRPDAGAGSGSGAVDTDHDMVADDKDNCIATANLDQANEDADKFGDACDVCPQINDNIGLDSDGDRVGDLCDPNPSMRDSVWLYNGFRAGLPAWSRSVNWTAMSDKLRTTADQANDDSEWLITEFANPASLNNFAASMTVLVEQTIGAKVDHSVGIEIFDGSAGVMKGVDCVLDAPNSASRILYLEDDFNNPGLSTSVNINWSNNAEYRLTLARHGSTYTCTVVGPGGPQTLSGTSAVVPRDGKAVDVWAYGVVAQYGSVQIIGAP